MCFTRKVRNKYNTKKNKVYPKPPIPYIGIETYECDFCKGVFDGDNIKIFCDGCEKFFHCHIAGRCIGENCTVILHNGNKHSSRYCLNCVNLNNKLNNDLKSDICICKNCE